MAPPPGTARTTACQRISVAQGTGGDRSKRGPHLRGNGRATRYQPRSPAQDVVRERERADPEELVRRELVPQAGEVLDRLRERTRIRGQVGHVDRAGRFAREDHRPSSRKVTREAPEHANLIGSSGAAATERDRQVTAWRVRDARLRAHRHPDRPMSLSSLRVLSGANGAAPDRARRAYSLRVTLRQFAGLDKSTWAPRVTSSFGLGRQPRDPGHSFGELLATGGIPDHSEIGFDVDQHRLEGSPS